MKKKLLALLLCAVLVVGLVPTLAADVVYFPEFSQTVGEAMKPDKAWPAIGSSAVPTQRYYGQTDDWENCKKLAKDYIDLLVGTGDFTVVDPFKVVYGKEGGEDVRYSADLRYTGSAPMNGTLKAMRAGGTWPDYGEYHITVRAERDASRPNAARRNSVEVCWDSALRPEGIDFYAGDDPGTTTPDPGTTTPGTGTTTPDPGTTVPDTGTTTPATNPGNAAGNSDNTFQDMGSAMGYYLEQTGGEYAYDLRAKKGTTVSYEELLQYAQEYVDLLVGQDNFYLIPRRKNGQLVTREDLSWSGGGCSTWFIRYTGTAPMQGNLASSSDIDWNNYGPFHLKVTVWKNEKSCYITVAWDNGLKPVESNRRTASGARLGSAEKPQEALTVVLGIGYNKMCVGSDVVPVESGNEAVTPVIENNRTLVPVSRIVAAFGGNSTWDAATRATGFYRGNYGVTHTVGTKEIQVTYPQRSSRSMNAASKLMHNRTYVPVRYILEGLGLWVGYEPTYQLVVVSTENLDGENLIKLPESQRLFASEPVPDMPRKTAEHYTIDGFNYTMEVGEALTLFNSRTAISAYSAYSWDVLEGGELVQVDRKEATCRFYAKRPGVVTIQSHLDQAVEGSSYDFSTTYTMTITITAATDQGSSGGLMHWQTCRTCNGTGKIQVGTRQETCSTCLGKKQVLM